jgi:hypothetical protein
LNPRAAGNAGLTLLFGVTFRGADHISQSAVLTYDGTNYHTVVQSDSAFATPIFPGSINDEGDINFAAYPIVPKAPLAFTYYIVPAAGPSAGTPLRIAGLNDTPPAACTWCVPPSASTGGALPQLEGLNVPALNAQGQMLLELWEGMFIGSKDGSFSVVPMASAGACSPQPDTSGSGGILFSGITGFLNDLGVVVFTNPTTSGSAAICVVPAGGSTPTPVVTSGDAAPAGLAGGVWDQQFGRDRF